MFNVCANRTARWGSRLLGKGSDLVVRFFFIFSVVYQSFIDGFPQANLSDGIEPNISAISLIKSQVGTMKYPVGLFTQAFVTPGTLKGKQKQHPTATIVYAQPEDDDGLP